jgi:hypothetical protein
MPLSGIDKQQEERLLAAPEGRRGGRKTDRERINQQASDLTDETLAKAQSNGVIKAETLLKEFWPHNEIPHLGPDNVERVGFGHALKKIPQPEEISLRQLELRLKGIAAELEPRIFTLLALQPGAETKIGYLYAIADILELAVMDPWDELWAAANAGDWHTVSLLLVTITWRAVDGDKVERRMAAGNLIFALREA